MSSELNQMSAIQVAPSGERSQGRGMYGVVCRGNPVWSIPERLELKFHERRYTSTLYLPYLTLPQEGRRHCILAIRLSCLGSCRSESTTAGSLTPLISWSRRSCWGDAHCHGASLITASDNGNVVWSIVDGSEWRTHWTRVSLTVCTVKLLSLQTLCWNIFWSWTFSSTFFVDCQPGSEVLIHVASSSVLRFH